MNTERRETVTTEQKAIQLLSKIASAWHGPDETKSEKVDEAMPEIMTFLESVEECDGFTDTVSK